MRERPDSAMGMLGQIAEFVFPPAAEDSPCRQITKSLPAAFRKGVISLVWTVSESGAGAAGRSGAGPCGSPVCRGGAGQRRRGERRGAGFLRPAGAGGPHRRHQALCQRRHGGQAAGQRNAGPGLRTPYGRYYCEVRRCLRHIHGAVPVAPSGERRGRHRPAGAAGWEPGFGTAWRASEP